MKYHSDSLVYFFGVSLWGKRSEENHRYKIRRRAGGAHGVQIAPVERRLRCLPPAQPLPDDGGPCGEARRARRASPRPTPVLAAALFCLPRAEEGAGA
jgi:hypothetical protein